ncbi:MAG: hypothetical protein U9N10_06685, partial [Bacillota bacterium]|nr:hypothetical protein [Bacillota bacterium]
GNGFEELKEYDKDGNNWIDENDEIFKDLRIWSLNENGDKELLSLYKANVGAIYLGHVNSDYSLKELDQTLGKIRETGVYLKETGDVGTIQHVDLNI